MAAVRTAPHGRIAVRYLPRSPSGINGDLVAGLGTLECCKLQLMALFAISLANIWTWLLEESVGRLPQQLQSLAIIVVLSCASNDSGSSV